MFESQVLDIAIGLIFVYCFLSLICLVVNEKIASIFKVRPRQLYDGLYNLLRDGNVLDKLYKHPLIIGMPPRNIQNQEPGQTQETVSQSDTSNAQECVRKFKKYYPSYISSRNFTLALLESVKDLTIEKEKQETGQVPYIPKLDTFQNIRSLVAKLPPDNEVRRSLLPLIDSAQGDFEKALHNIENWYDSSTDRISGWFKRFSQILIISLALLICAFLNADTIMMGKTLYENQTLRASIVATAQGVAQKSIIEDQAKFIEELQQKIEPLKFPLGWAWEQKPDPRAFPKDSIGWLGKIFGILLTALAISLGAPFWFDLLNKVTNLRGAGKKPLTAEEKRKE